MGSIGVIIIIVILCLITGVYDVYRNSIDRKVEERFLQLREKQQRPLNTRVLVFESLWNLKCNPKGGEDERITCEYQENQFWIFATEKCKYIKVCFPFWYRIPLSDIEALAIMQKAVNQANHLSDCKVLYSIYQEEGFAALHAQKHLLFISEYLERDEFLKYVFDEFFEVARFVVGEIEKTKISTGIGL
ncbi:MAG: hypothetical protein IJV27_10095 [Prevotella sp.]|nr:hypothetical protein [Prevotella sp.]